MFWIRSCNFFRLFFLHRSDVKIIGRALKTAVSAIPVRKQENCSDVVLYSSINPKVGNAKRYHEKSQKMKSKLNVRSFSSRKTSTTLYTMSWQRNGLCPQFERMIVYMIGASGFNIPGTTSRTRRPYLCGPSCVLISEVKQEAIG